MKGKDKTGLLLMAGVVVILMLLIFIVNVQRRTAEREAESIALGSSREESLSESQARSIAESLEAEQSEAQVERTLASCSDPAVEEMVKRFFDARLAADTTALFEIFGRNDPTVQDDSLTEKLTAEGSWVRSIDDIKVIRIGSKQKHKI